MSVAYANMYKQCKRNIGQFAGEKVNVMYSVWSPPFTPPSGLCHLASSSIKVWQTANISRPQSGIESRERRNAERRESRMLLRRLLHVKQCLKRKVMFRQVWCARARARAVRARLIPQVC